MYQHSCHQQVLNLCSAGGQEGLSPVQTGYLLPSCAVWVLCLLVGPSDLLMAALLSSGALTLCALHLGCVFTCAYWLLRGCCS